MQAFLVFLDVEGPILIEVAAEVYGPQLDDGLGHRFGPAHARSFHAVLDEVFAGALHRTTGDGQATCQILVIVHATPVAVEIVRHARQHLDRKSTRLNSSHGYISYAVFCLKKKILSPSITRLLRLFAESFITPNLLLNIFPMTISSTCVYSYDLCLLSCHSYLLLPATALF